MRFFAVLAVAAFVIAPSSGRAQNNVGGSTQVGAQSGCMKQWMFNGVWRVRVTNVAWQPAGDHPNAWNVSMQWANGTNYAGISPADTMKQNMVLALANGDTLTTTDTTVGTLNEQQLDFHTFPASGQFSYTQTFYGTQTLDQNNKPAKLLITFDVAKYKQYHPAGTGKFWKLKTKGYNYRIDLTCSK